MNPNSPSMNITQIKVIETTDYNELSGYCGDYHLWYRFPTFIKLEARADAFVAAALIPAMMLGKDIHIQDDLPISPRLLKNISIIQDAFYLWRDYSKKPLKKIQVIGGTLQPATANDKSISFFSGGVDGLHTFLRNKEEIDYLLFAKGIDIQLSNDSLYEQTFEENNNYLKKAGKTLLPIITNVRYLGHTHNVGWQSFCCGSGLASIALAGSFKKCLIASSGCFAEIVHEGSNYITDPLWHTESSTVIYDGTGSNRIDKIKYISQDQDATHLLRVCWQDKGYNCGKCEKCLRTMLILRVLGIKNTPFPELSTAGLKQLSKFNLFNDDYAYIDNECLKTAIDRNDISATKFLNHCKQNQEIKRLIKQLDIVLFKGQLLNLKRRLSQPEIPNTTASKGANMNIDHVTVKNTDLKGIGVFSLKDFSSGDVVIIGKPTLKQTEKTWLTLQMEKDRHIRIDQPFEQTNHSCDPNCGLKPNEFGGYNLVAMRQITKNDEITFDYCMSEWDPIPAITPCHCGSDLCREQINGGRSLTSALRQKYTGFMAPYYEELLFVDSASF